MSLRLALGLGILHWVDQILSEGVGMGNLGGPELRSTMPSLELKYLKSKGKIRLRRPLEEPCGGAKGVELALTDTLEQVEPSRFFELCLRRASGASEAGEENTLSFSGGES